MQRWMLKIVAALFVAGVTSAFGAAKSTIDFTKDIRPILSDNCFTCHGPDEKARKAKLRLDTKEDAFKEARSGGYAIMPGKPEQSSLIERITTTDEEEIMPPPKTGRKLTAAQKDLLKRWIAEGAQWQVHWAFEPAKKPELPKVNDRRFSKNPIDTFVAAKLKESKLKPAPRADKVTEIRRASLDLIGLPPTPQEVDAFLADKDPKAYEKVVDRLLASPKYGEHQARYWMDAARYADSHGYHIDSERSMWKWRDWVVDAFNKNMPYDQFTTEQLAGDLLPNPTTEQKVASGYIRANMSTGEGGAIDEEYQVKYTFDRLETTGTIWMGLTLTCARCHTHKYDPITHKEYYSLYSFFNNIDESIMDGNKPNPDPFIKLPSQEQAKRQGELKEMIKSAQAKIDAPSEELDKAQIAWQTKWQEKLNTGWTVFTPDKLESSKGATLAVQENQAILVSGENSATDIHELTIKPVAGTLAALKLEVMPHDSLPNKGLGRADDGRFRLGEIEVEIVTPEAEKKEEEEPKADDAKENADEKKDKKKENKPKKLKFGLAAADLEETNYEIAKAIDGKPETGWGVAAGAIKEPHTALFTLSEPVKILEGQELRVRLKFEASQSKRAIGHYRLSGAQSEDLIRLLNPPKTDPWQLLGPFKSTNLLVGLNTKFGPETNLDLKANYMGVREEIKWKAKADFEDGKRNLLVNELHGVHGAYYFYRTITVPDDREAQFTIRADGVFRLTVNGKQVAERTAPSSKVETVSVNLKKGKNKLLLKQVTEVGAAYLTFNKDLGETEKISSEVAVILASVPKLNGDQAKKVRNFYRRNYSEEYKKIFEDLDQWQVEDETIEKAIPTTLVAKERDKPRETMILIRGEYDKKGDKVGPGVPAILPPFPKDAPTNRLGLAKWLLDPQHPLTARVTVNRIWQQYFGVGLVKTTEDFGVQSEAPSHPQLLDWLATEFVGSGWDLKNLHKLIVTSETYRQTSKTSPKLIERDPENRLLARGPRHRLDGETIRDMGLVVSGLLVDKIGGRSVKPYEPPGLWEAVSFNNSQKYVQDKGDAQYRRSLYTHWKRQSPPANMLIFDAPTREYCVVRRPKTNTPLQALALLNDPQFVEMSKAFGWRIVAEGGSTIASRISYAFRWATGRKPARDEVKIIENVLKAQLAEYQKDQEAAAKLLKVGEFRPATQASEAELAAWTTVASMLLNLDETITKF